MGEVVNFRRAKKAKARAVKGAEAEANRSRFGRSKAERDLAKARREKAVRDLEAHRRDDGT